MVLIMVSQRLLQAFAEAAQLVVPDASGGPEEAGDEARGCGDLGLHGRPLPTSRLPGWLAVSVCASSSSASSVSR